MADQIYRQIFKGLVHRIGGVDAAAAVIEARTGSCTKSTVSKMTRGAMAVTVEGLVALEDALGSHPMTRLLFERVGAESGQTEPLSGLIAVACVESGEAMAALVGREMTTQQRAAAIAEVSEAIDAFEALRAALEASK